MVYDTLLLQFVLGASLIHLVLHFDKPVIPQGSHHCQESCSLDDPLRGIDTYNLKVSEGDRSRRNHREHQLPSTHLIQLSRLFSHRSFHTSVPVVHHPYVEVIQTNIQTIWLLLLTAFLLVNPTDQERALYRAYVEGLHSIDMGHGLFPFLLGAAA